MQKNCFRLPACWGGGPRLTKIWRFMRLTAFLLTAFFFQVQAYEGAAQTVSISGTNISLKEIFAAIEKQTGYVVFGKRALLESNRTVTIDAKNMPLLDFLDIVLRDQQISYQAKGKSIALSYKAESGKPVFMPVPPVSGRVVNLNGVGIPGVTITVKGSKRGTATGADGTFSLDVQEGDVLEFTAVGMAPLTLRLNKNEFQILSLSTRPQEDASRLLDAKAAAPVIQLMPSVSPLDEVQVIAYGTTTKRLSTGNITTVSAREIEQQPVSNPLLALQGRVPGLVITQANGYPGTPSGLSIRVQGQISINKGSDPLIVVDGMPYPLQSLPAISPVSYQQSYSALNFLNPGDIESIEVLKDADATSIYGSRAAAGAILITTKKGKAGRMRLDLTAQNGWSHAPQQVPLANTQEFLALRRHAFAMDGTAPEAGPGDYPVNGVWDTTRYTDWHKVAIGGTAQYKDVQLGVSGGNEFTQVRLGTAYNKQTLVSPGDFAVQRASINANMTNSSLNRRLKTDVGLAYSFNESHLPANDVAEMMALPPNAPPVFDANGNLNWARIPTGNGTDSVSTWNNPMATYLTELQKTTTHNFIGNFSFRYQLLPGLEISNQLGYNFQYANTTQLGGYLESFSPESRAGKDAWRFSRFINGTQRTLQVAPQINYRTNIGGGQLQAMAGGDYQHSSSFQQMALGSGYATDGLMWNISAAYEQLAETWSASEYKYAALFGRLNYNWKNKYIANINARRDGSSRFGSANSFHNFWSVAGVWIFSEEPWMNSSSLFSFGKLQASYGTTGNDQIGDFQYMDLYDVAGYHNPFMNSTTLSIVGLPNPYLQWEETHKFSSSLDLGFFKDRLLFNATFHRNRSSNQLVGFPLSAVTGFESITSNLPAIIQNHGWDFTFNASVIKQKDFEWRSMLTLSAARNRLVSFPDIQINSYFGQYKVGYPVTATKTFRLAGVNTETGIYEYYTTDGKLTSSPRWWFQAESDQTALMDVTPTFYGGFQHTLTYKGLSLDLFFQFAKQLGWVGYLYPSQIYIWENAPVDAYEESWKKPGDVARFQRLSISNNVVPNQASAGGAFGTSTGAYTDATHIRLRNFSLSYNIPQHLLSAIKFQQLKVFVQGQNMFTLTRFPFDPEVSGYKTLPPLRTITAGVTVAL